MFALRAIGVEKTYTKTFGRSGRRALAGVDLEIPRGSSFGLIGVNGAGKTTFIKAVLGIVRTSKGRIQLLDGSPEDIRVRARIGYLPERLAFPPAWTAAGYLASVARLKRLPRPQDEAARQLARVELEAERNQKLRSFSKGMRQRVGVAAALLGAPDLLILDEPTDGVDPLGRATIRRVLREEHGRGATLLLNSHLLSETERICDRVGILHRGRVLLEGPLESLMSGANRWRVVFEAGVPTELEALGFVPGAEAGTYLIDAPDETELNRALDRARATGALIVALSPYTRDLEDILRRELEA